MNDHRQRARELAELKEQLRFDDRWAGLGDGDRRERATHLLAVRAWVQTGRIGADDTAPEGKK